MYSIWLDIFARAIFSRFLLFISRWCKRTHEHSTRPCNHFRLVYANGIHFIVGMMRNKEHMYAYTFTRCQRIAKKSNTQKPSQIAYRKIILKKEKEVFFQQQKQHMEFYCDCGTRARTPHYTTNARTDQLFVFSSTFHKMFSVRKTFLNAFNA